MNTEEVVQRTHFLGMPVVLSSQPMLELLALVRKVARTHVAVLISGESGSGKELIARAVHCYSTRAEHPWVDVSCATLPEHLIESELFGYEKGAFSGAQTNKPGLFELAHGGTLFLDEIGELDSKMQTKLLRVLDSGAFYRLGSTRRTCVDVRIVAATNRDLQKAIQKGTFREDLYHRLSQFTLVVPPLRERRADILPIAHFFLSQQDESLRLSREAERALLEYHWPGNVRELRNVILKAAILAADGEVTPGNLDLDWRRPVPIGTSGSSLEDVERDVIMQTLIRTGGHQQKAADLLGISRRTLCRRLKEYQEEVPEQSGSEFVA